MSSILGVGQSALAAAQAGLTTTGHNIANASTPGYSRQVVIQGSAFGQDAGYGFVGKGTQVVTVQRIYDEYLSSRVLTAQTSQNELNSYYSQIKEVNNLFADPTSGVAPALQGFFAGVSDVAKDPRVNSNRQTLLSSAETLAAQFREADTQLQQMRDGLNTNIRNSIGNINSYAKQIAHLNDAIEKAQAGDASKPPNDLLDQRDQIVSELSKEIKVNVVKQNDSYNVFIGNGQPLVVATSAYSLVATASPTDLGRAEIAYVANGKTIGLAESSVAGGKLGGYFEFRAKTLDEAQNSIGRMAIALGTTFNAQHALGQDNNGAMGGKFFNFGSPVVTPSAANSPSSTGKVSASISNVDTLTASNYQVQWDGSKFNITRIADGAITTSPTMPLTVDGVDFNISGSPAAGDVYLVKPTASGATNFTVAITDASKVAASSPIFAQTVATNKGTGTISAGAVDATYTAATVTPAITLAYDSATTSISGFPAGLNVTVVDNGVSTTYPAPAGSIPFTPNVSNATISFGGISFSMSGAPANNDSFTVGRNSGGSGDNANMLLLGKLQLQNTMDNGNSTFQGAYGQLVNAVGNKTHELDVTSSAETKFLAQATEAQQGMSGVNLDEEATNLLRYQQAYVAAGKVMQTASKLFDVLLTLGQ